MNRSSFNSGLTVRGAFFWLVLFLCFAQSLWAANFIHDNGRVYVDNTYTFDDISIMRWPYKEPTERNLLSWLRFVVAADYNGGKGASEAYDFTLQANNSFTDKDGVQTSVQYYGDNNDLNGATVLIEDTIRTYAVNKGPKTNSVELQYKVTNTGTQTITALYLGNNFFFDLPNPSTVVMNIDSARSMYYAQTADSSIFVGARVLSGKMHSAHTQYNSDAYSIVADGVIETIPANVPVNGFSITLSQKFSSITPNTSSTYVFGIFFGASLQDIQSASDNAYQQYGGLGGSGGAIVKDVIYSGSPQLDTQPTSSGGGCLIKKN